MNKLPPYAIRLFIIIFIIAVIFPILIGVAYLASCVIMIFVYFNDIQYTNNVGISTKIKDFLVLMFMGPAIAAVALINSTPLKIF